MGDRDVCRAAPGRAPGAARLATSTSPPGVIRVERGWDYKEGAIELKSNAGRRRVPIAAVLRDHLLEHQLRVEREGEQLLFGRTAGRPVRSADALQRRADKAWQAAGLGADHPARVPPHLRLADDRRRA